MSSTQNAPARDSEELRENSGIGVSVSPINPGGVPNVEPVDISSHNTLNTDAGTDPVRNAHREAQVGGQETRGMDEGGVSLLIPGAPPILKGLDSKKFGQKPFLQSASQKPVPKKFRMPDIPKYNGTTNPNEHITTYTCGIKRNDLEDDEIESVLLKTFGETLSKGSMIWYHNLPPNSIDSFAMLADSFMKAHGGAIKVATRKYDVFKIKQKDNEMLREFLSHFQSERMKLPPVSDDWVIQAFTQGINE
ncbi:PREDICTED: uncharacterized protein LOC109211954 [Nicotiana attenuata]|uniref:uncharacterized protein LOC109211954 n=1 Tax=Nicotiana attenuata TaxID=49451 RepID=UPI0009057997|nr:PREDICTED: uncharacterized protein LOC109211954 [Nicotiana attenuata]